MSSKITGVLVVIVLAFAAALGGVMLATSHADTASAPSTSPVTSPVSSASAPSSTTRAQDRRSRVQPSLAPETRGAYNPTRLLPRDDPNYGAQTQEHIDAAQKFAVDTYPNKEVSSFDVVVPGSTLIYTASADGGNYTCTAGFIARGGETNYLLTAGHCMSAAQTQVPVSFVGKDKQMAEAGMFEKGQTMNESLSAGLNFDTDISAVALGPDTPGDFAIARTKYLVTGVATPDELTAGVEVCKWGAKTMETCGKVLAVNDSIVRVNLYSAQGDSGSPAYIRTGVTDASGREEVRAVGVLSGSPEDIATGETFDYVTDFALVAPVADAWGLDLVPYL